MTEDDFSTINLNQLRENRQWQAQYRVLMNWGSLIQPKPDLRRAEHKLKGCATDAWLAWQDGSFYFDSDSRIINGLAALILSQHQAGNGELKEGDWQTMLRELGLTKHLSPSRNNGVHALISRMSELKRSAL